MLEQAIAYAARKHEGQTRKDGTPYIYHPITVAEMVKDAGYDESVQTVAVLHDVLEDTDATEEELYAMFGEEVTEAVKLLTRREGQDETEYLQRILENPMSAPVKNADRINNVLDAVHNGTPGQPRTSRNWSFAKRYLDKTKRYYQFKFSQALDMAILEAEAVLLDSIVRQKRSIIFTKEDVNYPPLKP